MTPAIGSRWRDWTGSAWEYLGAIDEPGTTYCHALRLLDRTRLHMTPLGHVIHVELPWFERAAKEIKP